MNRTLLSLAGALLVLAAGLWFWFSFDIVPTTRQRDASPEVSRDSYTAFVRGLPEGVSVVRYEDLADLDLDMADWVLIDWQWLRDEDPDLWAVWVENGGRLLVQFSEPEDLDPAWNGLFEGLAPKEGAIRLEGGDPPSAVARGGDQDLRVWVDPSVVFDDAPDPETTVYQTAEETPLIVRNVGSGWVLASGAPLFLTNEGLRTAGNRRFAAALVAGLDDATLWLPAVPAAPESPAGLGNAALGLSLVLLALLIYWRSGPRLGPVLDAGTPDRLGLGERFLAEGRFLWRHRALPGQGRLSARQFIRQLSHKKEKP